jgi:HSP20 family protein
MAVERWKPFGTTMEQWQPFRAISEVQSEMNRLFDTVFGHPASAASGERTWVPVCDLWETKDELVLCVELPGVSDKDVNVSITGDLLSVKGERRFPQDNVKDDNWHRLERAWGKFERTVQLPMPVQADKVKATYRDGLLTVKLPKAEDVKSKDIKIDIL